MFFFMIKDFIGLVNKQTIHKGYTQKAITNWVIKIDNLFLIAGK